MRALFMCVFSPPQVISSNRAIKCLTTPRGGATPLPRRAQPLLLLFRSNPNPLRGEGGVKSPCANSLGKPGQRARLVAHCMRRRRRRRRRCHHQRHRRQSDCQTRGVFSGSGALTGALVLLRSPIRPPKRAQRAGKCPASGKTPSQRKNAKPVDRGASRPAPMHQKDASRFSIFGLVVSKGGKPWCPPRFTAIRILYKLRVSPALE